MFPQSSSSSSRLTKCEGKQTGRQIALKRSMRSHVREQWNRDAKRFLSRFSLFLSENEWRSEKKKISSKSSFSHFLLHQKKKRNGGEKKVKELLKLFNRFFFSHLSSFLPPLFFPFRPPLLSLFPFTFPRPYIPASFAHKHRMSVPLPFFNPILGIKILTNRETT